MGAPPLPKFSPAQREHILSFLDDFTKYLTQYNPNVQNYHSGTTKWISATSAAVMQHELFDIGNLSGKNPSEVEGDIRTFFRNWKNNTYKKSLPSTITITSTCIPSGSASSASPMTPVSPGLAVALNDALRGLVIFDPDLSPKDLMFREKPELYRKAYQEIKGELPTDTPTVVIAQKARKRAWESVDQEEWAQRKRALELDTARNQGVWAPFLREAIQQNLDRGIVGTSAVGVMYAFRTESEGLQYGILYAGHDSATKTETQHQPQSHAEILKLWREHADIYLKTPDMYQFEREAGTNFPKLPELDLDDVVVRQVAAVLTHYLAAVWDHGYPADNAMPCLPWLRLALDAEAHYDTDIFALPWTIGQPIPCKLSDTLSLYERLKELQDAGTPFRFRSKEDYLERAGASAAQLDTDLEQGDEVFGNPRATVIQTDEPVVKALVIVDPASEGPAIENVNPAAPPVLKPAIVTPVPEVPVIAEPTQEQPVSEELAVEPPIVSKTKKAVLKRSLDDTTNSQGTRRESTRARKAAGFGITLVANGQRSPQGRKSSWFLTLETENQPEPSNKRARRL